MTPDVVQRQGPDLSSLLAAGLTLIVAMLVVTPLWELASEQDEAIAQQREQLAFYRGEIASGPRFKAVLAAQLRRQARDGKLLGGANAALSAAVMQDILKTVATLHGGQILSVQQLPSSRQQALEKISLQVEMTVPLGGLKGIVYDLETGSPFLFIDDATIRSTRNAASIGAAPSNVELRCTVHGYRRGGAA